VPTSSRQQASNRKSALPGTVNLAISLSFGVDNDEEIYKNSMQINDL
jgi:hypothetical protein